MIEVLMNFALAFGISFYAFPVIIHVANERKLFDHPDDFRKIHRSAIPSMGGLGMFAGIFISFLLISFHEGYLAQVNYLMLSALVLFFLGAKDDLQSLAPIKKFLGQVLAASILVFKGGFVLNNMEGVFGFYELPDTAAYGLTILTIIVIINAYNLIDGVDGLASSLSLVSCGFFCLYFLINNDFVFAGLSAAIIGSLLAFLIFNFSPAKIFMGDTGSLLLGLLHAVLVIHFISSNAQAPVWSVDSVGAMGFIVLFVPLFDTLRVFSARIVHGVSPFTPDRNHIHHILLRAGFSHSHITISLVVFNLLLILGGYALSGVGSSALFWLSLLLGSVAFGSVLIYYQSKMLKSANASATNGQQNSVEEKKGSIRTLSFEQRSKAN